MDERTANKEQLGEAYWTEAISAVELGLFRFDTGPEAERLHREYIRMLSQPQIALG
jgi:hypothetical protein